MAVRVREEKSKTMKEASEIADSYELARRAEGGGAGLQQAIDLPPRQVSVTSRPSSQRPTSKAGFQGGVQRSKTNSKGDILCWECKQYGHTSEGVWC